MDEGYAIYDARTGDRLSYWKIGPFLRVDLARWVTRSVFVLLGEYCVEHPKSTAENWVEAWVPAVWVGDVESERMVIYVGVPTLPIYRVPLERKLAKVRASVYPNVTWR